MEMMGCWSWSRVPTAPARATIRRSWQANVAAMNKAALAVFRRGHVPVTGEALALPLIELAGSERVGDAVFDEIFHPIARRVLARCDAVLRIGGASAVADEMVALARAQGKLVATGIDDLP
jgi:hypothetical protein